MPERAGDRVSQVRWLFRGAPAIFDRFERGVDLGYEPNDISIGKDLKAKGNDNLQDILADVEAAYESVSARSCK